MLEKADMRDMTTAGDTATIHDMKSVRMAIDALDEKLVEILGQRLALIRRASELKGAPEDARVPWRVEDVAAKVRAHAACAGFDPDIAERIWRGMMEECIAFEERELAARRG